MILRCTQKFLTELCLKKTDIIIQPQPTHPLDEWYAHVFFLYPRRKCAVFVHAKTVFCFFALDIKREDLNHIGTIFHQKLGKALLDEHYPATVIKIFNERIKEIRVTSTLDRVMIGTINRMVLDLRNFGNETERTMFRNEAVMGAYFRRGAYMAFRGAPLNRMRGILSQLKEIRDGEISAPLSDKAISEHLGVDSIYF